MWSTWFWTFGNDIFIQPKFYTDVLTLYAWNVSYASLYNLGYVLVSHQRHQCLPTPSCLAPLALPGRAPPPLFNISPSGS